MIIYESGGWDGPNKLFRIHGSAVYKGVLPTLMSTGVLFMYEYIPLQGLVPSILRFVSDNDSEYNPELTVIQHPFTIGAFIGFFSLLITFRLNFAYGRYSEGATTVYGMISKFLDCAMILGAFHYQSNQFDNIRPPCFGTMHKFVTEDQIEGYDRETPLSLLMKKASDVVPTTTSSKEEHDSSTSSEEPQKVRLFRRLPFRRRRATNESVQAQQPSKNINCNDTERNSKYHAKIPIPMRFQDQLLNPSGDQRYYRETADARRERLLELKSGNKGVTNGMTKTPRARLPAPSLFLQETAHLISLLNAVALSTLRNDIAIASSPVTPYVPGVPWPDVDPDNLPRETKKLYGDGTVFWRWLYFCLGLSRSAKRRTLYNAARPFGVLGGVSDGEIHALQNARGPCAKVALVSMWLQEFISREHLAGSTGEVPAPLLSRIHQFISDGIISYNQARKVAYVPYPFASAQIASFFSLSIIFIFPMLFISFVTKLWFAAVLNFLTVLCFLGLNEVSRELENPFQNIPNDLPLTTYQAEFNEALVTIYAGFHPDSWWEVIDVDALNFIDDEVPYF